MYCDCLKEIAEAIIVDLKKKKRERCCRKVFFLYRDDKNSKVRDIYTLKPTGFSHFLALQSKCESHIDHQ